MMNLGVAFRGSSPSTRFRTALRQRNCTWSQPLPYCTSHVLVIPLQTRKLRPLAPRARLGKATEQSVHLKVDLPKAANTRAREAIFVGSSINLPGCPKETVPEFAVIGRSNVGKSSLINALAGVHNLATVSKKPGHTTCIHHFLINKAWYLVDLPGYGYARAAKTNRLQWVSAAKQYFLNRQTLAHVFLLVDCSLPPQPADLECAGWLAGSEVPFSIVFTKSDLAKKDQPPPLRNQEAFKKGLLQEWEQIPQCFTSSSKTGQGTSELLQYIAGLRELFKAS